MKPASDRVVPGLAAFRLLVIPAACLVVSVAFLAGCRSRAPEPPPAPVPTVSRPKLTADQLARVATRYNLAVASLGMADYRDAVSQWEELSQTLPDDPAVANNRAVAHLLWLRTLAFARRGENGEFAAALPAAQRAVQGLLMLCGDEAGSHLLAAKLARLAGDESGTWSALDRAAALAPRDPLVWFERFQTGRGAGTDMGAKRAAEAIRRTHELVPDNLFVLIQLIWQQAADRDPAIAASLPRLRQRAEPLVGDSPRLGKQDLAALFDQSAVAAAVAVSSADPNEWKTLTAVTRRIGNVLLAETPTRIDFRRLDRQNERDVAELEFVRPRFDTASRISTPERVGGLGPPISVRLHPAPDNVQLPVLADMQAVQLLDFDLDGQQDVVAVGRRSIEMYGHAVGSGVWQQLASFDSPRELRGVAAADLDRDVPLRGSAAAGSGFQPGDADLIAFGPAGVLVLENSLDGATGRRCLREAGQASTFGALSDVWAVGLADLDHDGDVDVVVSAAAGVSLWSNEGHWAFREISQRSVLPAAGLTFRSILAEDENCDRDIDVQLAGAARATSGWLLNRRHGRFAWRPDPADKAPAVAMAPRRLWDYDNDGCQDAITWDSSGLAFWQGVPGGRLHAVSLLHPCTFRDIRDCAVGDLDADGDWDVVAVTPERVVWLVNDGGNHNGWIDVVLEPEANPEQFPDQRINLDGRGCLVEVRVGPVCQSQTATLGPVHFGLGTASEADTVQVRWTNGLICTRRQAPAGRRLRVEQVLKGM